MIVTLQNALSWMLIHHLFSYLNASIYVVNFIYLPEGKVICLVSSGVNKDLIYMMVSISPQLVNMLYVISFAWILHRLCSYNLSVYHTSCVICFPSGRYIFILMVISCAEQTTTCSVVPNITR